MVKDSGSITQTNDLPVAPNTGPASQMSRERVNIYYWSKAKGRSFGEVGEVQNNVKFVYFTSCNLFPALK